MLTDQHVLSWIGASHSSCLSHWIWDPSWAAAPGGGMRPAQGSRTLSPAVAAVALLLAEKVVSIARIS